MPRRGRGEVTGGGWAAVLAPRGGSSSPPNRFARLPLPFGVPLRPADVEERWIGILPLPMLMRLMIIVAVMK